MDVVSDAVLSVDEDQRILDLNRAAERIFGYDRNELRGRPLDILLLPSAVQAHREHIRKHAEDPAAASSVAEGRAVRGKRRGGEEFPAEATFAKLIEGESPSYHVVLRDDTAREAVAASLHEVSRRLSTWSRFLSDLTSGEDPRALLNRLVRSVGDFAPPLEAIILPVTPPDGPWSAAGSDLPEGILESVEDLRGEATAWLEDQEAVAALSADPVWTEVHEHARAAGYPGGWAVPLRHERGSLPLGVLLVFSPVERGPTPRERRILSEVAVLVKLLLEREECARKAREVSDDWLLVRGVYRRLSRNLAPGQQVRVALDCLEEALHPDLAVIFRRSGDRLTLLGQRSGTKGIRHSATPEHRVGECLCGIAAREGMPVYSEDVAADPRCTWPECREAGIRSFAALPLLAAEEVVGVVGLASTRPRDFENRDRFLQSVAEAITLPVRDAMQHEQILNQRAELERAVAHRTAELSEALEQARKADRLKSAFLATMSHELRTPLNSIIGFTGVMQQGLAGPLTEEQSKQLGMVRTSASHLLNLINDVLDLSRIEAGELRISPELFDVRESIGQVLRSVGPLAEAKGLTLESRIDPEVEGIVSDRRRFEQVLLNLLGNAVKFTHRGGIILDARIEEGYLAVRVEDTGIGIQTVDLKRVFDTFSQIDTGLDRNHEGTGLGLAICRRLSEILGGDLSVESEHGAGSTFTFRLPSGRGHP